MHTIHTKKKLVARVRRLRGQIEAIERALEGEEECAAVLQQVAAARGALNGLVTQLIEEHLRQHVLGAEGARSPATRKKAADEIIEVVRSYLK